MADNTSKDEPKVPKSRSRLSRKKRVHENDSESNSEALESSQSAVVESSLSESMKKKQRSNWTPRECRALVTGVCENYDILFGNHGGSDRTETEKHKVWITVRDAVNA